MTKSVRCAGLLLTLVILSSATPSHGGSDSGGHFFLRDAFAMDFTPYEPEYPFIGATTRQAAEEAADPTLSPFCAFDRQRDEGPIDPKNCVSWAEMEVDMLVMYLDLIAHGVPTKTAISFYAEIRCLSRSNLVFNNKASQLNVCFRRDYSEVVGKLLAKYVEPVFSELDVDASDHILATSSRVVLLNFTTAVRQSEFDSVFDSLSQNPGAARSLSTSCCPTCASTRYFPYFTTNLCVTKPNGPHCCHTVCKALDRIKIGMSESVSYCCPDLHPQVCLS